MGLITENNRQYYTGSQWFTLTTTAVQDTFQGWLNTTLVDATTYNAANYTLQVSADSGVTWIDYTTAYSSGSYTTDGTAVTATVSVIGSSYDTVRILLSDSASYYNYGGYSYVTLNDIVNNFLIGYVGTGKLIQSVKRTDVLFHAKRGLQEFSYDTLKSIKSQELVVPSSLSVVIPQDYVNYVKISRIDDSGVKRIIYPTRLTSNPTEIPVQDTDGIPTQDSFGENEQTTSTAESGWSGLDPIDDDYDTNKQLLGQRYGLDPETTQINDWFTINEREHKISFSSGLSGDTIILEYISDGLAYDNDTRIPKLAEEAMYMHIAYSILAGRVKQPEYVVQRFKKDRRAALRNAKLRLSNIKLEEITQVLKGKFKQIK
tara:strand:- start:3337 stop:4458 length:1122 start_codon:yes stop_codon:yes gene_type:complete